MSATKPRSWNTAARAAPADKFEPYRIAIRAAGFRINPFRLGMWVGRAKHEWRAPYTNPRSIDQYRCGLARGLGRAIPVHIGHW